MEVGKASRHAGSALALHNAIPPPGLLHFLFARAARQSSWDSKHAVPSNVQHSGPPGAFDNCPLGARLPNNTASPSELKGFSRVRMSFHRFLAAACFHQCFSVTVGGSGSSPGFWTILEIALIPPAYHVSICILREGETLHSRGCGEIWLMRSRDFSPANGDGRCEARYWSTPCMSRRRRYPAIPGLPYPWFEILPYQFHDALSRLGDETFPGRIQG